MSQSCPLCGKSKPEEALFCDDCAKKIQAEYEVDIQPEMETLNSPMVEPKQQIISPKQKKRIGTPLLSVLAIVLLTGVFFIYNETIRKTSQDSKRWDVALRSNSVDGYLGYMEEHPNGAHFDEAQAGLHRLKSEEAAVWERMKVTANPAELRDFLQHHPESPYARLVKTRLDSLVWVRALQANTADAYSDYIMQAGNGSVAGDYIAEARIRYELLLAPPPAGIFESDSLSETRP